MAETFPWFRFYGEEALGDRKLKRIARELGRPYAEVLGVWAIVLSIAGSSPVRGQLLLDDDLPANDEDLIDYMGLDLESGRAYLRAFLRPEFDMLGVVDGVYVALNFERRQAPSDSSAERVSRYRQRKKEAAQRQQHPEPLPSEGVTLPERYSNGGETVPEGELDLSLLPSVGEREEKEGESSSSAPSPVGGTLPLPEIGNGRDDDSAEALLMKLFDGRDPPVTQWAELASLIKGHGRTCVERYLRAARTRDVTGKRALPYVQQCIDNDRKEVPAGAGIIGSPRSDPHVGL